MNFEIASITFQATFAVAVLNMTSLDDVWESAVLFLDVLLQEGTNYDLELDENLQLIVVYVDHDHVLRKGWGFSR